MGKRPATPIAARFALKVAKGSPDACWPWLGKPDAEGYGVIWDEVSRKTKKAHRVAWELENGPIPDGMDILHRCDNPPCCNPKHLYPGTHLDNMRDREERGRTNPPRGEAVHGARLTEASVRDIRERLARGERYAAVAATLGIDRATVNDIRRGRTWKHVT